MEHGPAVRRALRYIDASIRDELDLTEAAARAGYSSSQFHIAFAKVTGQTPAEYVRCRRLALACWDLAFSLHRILDIALTCGFSTQESFTRAFKRKFGVTPGRFRARARGRTCDAPASGASSRLGADVRMAANEIYPQAKTLDGVMTVGFHLEDGRCPEDVPFPSCLAAVMRYLGEDYPWLPIHAHNREWRLNYGNVHFLGASGMAFGLLWKEGWHGDNVDHMFIADPREVIDRAFRAAGYAYTVVAKQGREDDEARFRQSIMDSITKGIPVLAFGVVGPPECCIVTGYEAHCESVVGRSYFQADDAFSRGVSLLPSGYFRKEGWFADTWNLVVVGDKVADFDTALTSREMVMWGLAVMRQAEILGRHAGFAAFDAWERHLLNEGDFADADEDTLRRFHGVHNGAVGTLAECRAWASSFVRHIAHDEPQMADQLERAACQFDAIHDAMWEAWGVVGGIANADAWQSLGNAEVRRKLAAIVCRAKAMDIAAAAHLQSALADSR